MIQVMTSIRKISVQPSARLTPTRRSIVGACPTQDTRIPVSCSDFPLSCASFYASFKHHNQTICSQNPGNRDRRDMSLGQPQLPWRYLMSWSRIEDPAWEAVAAHLPRPWPQQVCLHDLRWWVGRARASRGRLRLPGRAALALRWGVTDWQVRVLLRQRDRWEDPWWRDPAPPAPPPAPPPSGVDAPLNAPPPAPPGPRPDAPPTPETRRAARPDAPSAPSAVRHSAPSAPPVLSPPSPPSPPVPPSPPSRPPPAPAPAPRSARHPQPAEPPPARRQPTASLPPA